MEHLCPRAERDDKFTETVLPMGVPPKSPVVYHARVEFKDFLKVRDWNEEDLLSYYIRDNQDLYHTASSASMMEATAMVFEWLYFGLLEGILRADIQREGFLKYKNGQWVLDSDILPLFLKTFYARVNALEKDSAERESWKKDASDTLDHVKRVLNSLVIGNNSGWTASATEEHSEELGKILPPTIILAELLDIMSRRILDIGNIPEASRFFFPERAKLDREMRLLELGWCPFTIRNLQWRFPNSFLSWLDLTRRKSLSSGHKDCSMQQCEVHMSSKSKTQHLKCELGYCNFIIPSLEEVKKILDRGAIPVIYVIDEQERRSGIQLKVQAWKLDQESSSKPFIAISHVWSQGLGSTTEQGLPVCQLRCLARLCRMTSEFGEHCGFWIDSLCIPKDPEWRGKAMSQLRTVYQHAESVLVIDNCIRNASVSKSPEDLALVIYTSPWMGRLWTYQEGILASKLTFDVDDNIFRLDLGSYPLLGRGTHMVIMLMVQEPLELEIRRLTGFWSTVPRFLLADVTRALYCIYRSQPEMSLVWPETEMSCMAGDGDVSYGRR
jgi:hypothetical protein